MDSNMYFHFQKWPWDGVAFVLNQLTLLKPFTDLRDTVVAFLAME